ncbi:MAG TPA: HEAT repeat domain-containing protein [Bryobacteraceae bacterium]|nr:HEAT repeat domain-containing protein [Bryobacteraceae bacterium]
MPDLEEFYDVVAASEEECRDWIARLALLVGTLEAESRQRILLEDFLRRRRHHIQKQYGGVLYTSMSFLDSQDYEKRPWDDDSDVLFEALPFSPFDIASLLTLVLAKGNPEARRIATKWLPKYLDDASAIPLLTRLILDEAPAVRRWAAVHLSRLAPGHAAIVPVLVEALQDGKGLRSDRLYWDFGLTGCGEAAEALGHLGSRGSAAIPDLLLAVHEAHRMHCDYDGQLAARAVVRIAGSEWAVGLLEPVVAQIPWMAQIVDECRQASQGITSDRSPDNPAHACFFARFLWREGEDDYWRHRPRNPRGAF